MGDGPSRPKGPHGATRRGDGTLLIVVGAHPSAERDHRPIAYALRDQVRGMLAQGRAERGGAVPEVLVCTDLWYLNDESLKGLPTISIGEPGVNALSAFLASRLPSAFVIDDVLIVQVDPEMHTPLASCWGATPHETTRAVEVFVDKYAQAFVETLLNGW